MTEELVPVETLIRQGFEQQEARSLSRRRELVSTVAFGGLTQILSDVWFAAGVIASVIALNRLWYYSAVVPRRRRGTRVLVAVRDAPDTIAEIAYRSSGVVVVVMRDGTRLTLRYDIAVRDAAEQIASICPNARLHEGKPGSLELAPARAQLLPPK